MAISSRRFRIIAAVVVILALTICFELWSSWRHTRSHQRRTKTMAPSLTSSSSATLAVPATAVPEPSISIAPRIPTPLPRKTAVGASPNANSILNAEQEAFAPPDEEAMIEIDKVSLMIRDYRTIAGENPVGTNAEIMAAVMGENRKQAKLGPPEGMKLNEKGELIDRWGTPYFFHQISRDHMEIRSAGPDKILWTDDDPIIR
ncbi:MAG: hypothetical protein ACXWGY_04060 [Chthoniobacterales bacterium]